jgi:hypothetical protein
MYKRICKTWSTRERLGYGQRFCSIQWPLSIPENRGVRQLPFMARSCDKKQVFNVFNVHRPTDGRYRPPTSEPEPNKCVAAKWGAYYLPRSELRGGFRANRRGTTYPSPSHPLRRSQAVLDGCEWPR